IDDRGIEAKQAAADLKYYDLNSDETTTLIASETTYNEFAELLDEDLIHLEYNQVIAVKQSDAIMAGYGNEEVVDQTIQIENGEELQLKGTRDNGVLPESMVHYIVSDEVYEQLPEPSRIEGNTVWKAAKGQQEEVIH